MKMNLKKTLIILGVAAYILLPMDVVNDAILGLGQLDDLIVTIIGVLQIVRSNAQPARVEDRH